MDEKENAAQRKCKICIYEASEISVVLCPNAIVQPVTMVVELFTTPVAATTVLGALLHVDITYVAVKVHWGAIVIPDWSE